MKSASKFAKSNFFKVMMPASADCTLRPRSGWCYKTVPDDEPCSWSRRAIRPKIYTRLEGVSGIEDAQEIVRFVGETD